MLPSLKAQNSSEYDRLCKDHYCINVFLTGLVGTLSEGLTDMCSENILSLWTIYRDNVKVRYKVSGHSARETEDRYC